MKTMFWLAVAFMLSTSVYGEVVRSAAEGFEIRVEVTVPVAADAAYTQFLKVGEWWDPNHSWFGKASGFSIDPNAGGCFCERDGDRSVLHMIVSFVDPGKQLSMIGGLGPLQGLGLYGAMSWTFEPISDEQSKITHVYRVTGYYPEGLESLAPVVDRVQTGQVKRLQAKLADTL